jgi:hypothetical protein
MLTDASMFSISLQKTEKVQHASEQFVKGSYGSNADLRILMQAIGCPNPKRCMLRSNIL